jgi:uncharacterized membrane protein
MAMEVIAWLIALPLLGTAAGLRTMTPMAVLCWFTYAGHLPLDNGWDAWVGKLPVAVIFTVLAVGELIADKFPWIPNRTAPGPMVTRLLIGGLIGAIVADGLNGPGLEGVILGVLGALVGTYGGFLVRRDLVQKFGFKDWHVALAEDLLAVVSAVFAMGVVTG